MPSIQEVTDAFRAAARAYDIDASGQGCIEQRDLLPVSVLAADQLLGLITPPPSPRPFICAAGMMDGGDRQWVTSNLANASHYRCNNMVDVCAMRGGADPYEVLLTMESEGWKQNGASLTNHGAAGNAAMWDLYKLLQVTSPCRVFVTLTSDRHHTALLQATAHLASAYESSVMAGELIAVQVPSASLRRTDALVSRWPAGAWSSPPATARVRLV